jgi:hypothetical protein
VPEKREEKGGLMHRWRVLMNVLVVFSERSEDRGARNIEKAAEKQPRPRKSNRNAGRNRVDTAEQRPRVLRTALKPRRAASALKPRRAPSARRPRRAASAKPLIFDRSVHPALNHGRFRTPAYLMYEEFGKVRFELVVP